MDKYAVLKIPSIYLGDVLTGDNVGALMVDKVFKTYLEAEAYVVHERSVMSGILYFIWHLTEEELAILLDKEEE